MGKVEDILLKYSPEQIQAALISMASGESNYKNGGKIHIKKSHRGRLTELKKRTGKTEAELYNDGNPAHRKMVVFARNARKWNHADGGLIHKYDGESEDSSFLDRLLSGLADARDARIGAVGAQQVRQLYDNGNAAEAQNLARALTGANLGSYLHSFQEGGILVNPSASNQSVPFPTDTTNAQQVAQDSTAVQAIPVSKYKELEDIADRQRYLESGYKDDAVSKAGARGAFQVVQNTQKHWEEKMGWSGDINDYAYNKQIRDAELEWAYDTGVATKGNPTPEVRLAKALAMYNRGYGNIVKDLEKAKSLGYDIYKSLDWIDVIPMAETRNYIRFMLGQDVGGRLTNKEYEKAKAAFIAEQQKRKK